MADFLRTAREKRISEKQLVELTRMIREGTTA
jgi:hypothetical protein